MMKSRFFLKMPFLLFIHTCLTFLIMYGVYRVELGRAVLLASAPIAISGFVLLLLFSLVLEYRALQGVKSGADGGPTPSVAVLALYESHILRSYLAFPVISLVLAVVYAAVWIRFIRTLPEDDRRVSLRNSLLLMLIITATVGRYERLLLGK